MRLCGIQLLFLTGRAESTVMGLDLLLPHLIRGFDLCMYGCINSNKGYLGLMRNDSHGTGTGIWMIPCHCAYKHGRPLGYSPVLTSQSKLKKKANWPF